MKTYNFKRIGDLQTIGIAFISLFVDEKEDALYVSVRTSRESNAHPVFILSSVSPVALCDYMQKKVSLKKTMRQSGSLMLRFYDEQNQWETEPVKVEELNKWIPRDNRFVSSHCHDRSIINYYITKHYTPRITKQEK